MKSANQHYQNHIATENLWQHGQSPLCFTDGVKQMAEDNEAYWLVDLILSLQKKAYIRHFSFQVWELKKVTEEAFVIRATNGNDIVIHIGFIPFVAFPFDSCNLWFTNQCLMLPSEY